jgi:phospholipid/cholesterol/gamma-HCH transport system permease protein
VRSRAEADRSVAAQSWSLDAGSNGEVVLRLSGRWGMRDHVPSRAAIAQQFEVRRDARVLAFDTGGVEAWDSRFVVFVRHVLEAARDRQLAEDLTGLPTGVRKLLELAARVPEVQTGRRALPGALLPRIGTLAARAATSARQMITFLGEACLALARFPTGRAQFRRADLMVTIQEAGPEAFGIVSLISFLVGVILAYVGAVQLRQIGAELLVADLVAIGMARHVGPMMTAVVMAGRTGAAYAAQLGTMRVNEEIDALQTMSFSPVDFLVLPRMLGLIVMMPLLTIYADIVGILGGMAVGVGMLNVSLLGYWTRTWQIVHLSDFAVGVVSASVFGVLVAVTGCLRGMQSGRSAAAVGLAATSAVVTGIVCIVVAEAILAVIYSALGV